MIYDFARSSLESLAAEFNELRIAFESLATALDKANDPGQASNTRELKDIANALHVAIGGAASRVPNSGTAKGALETARDMFARAGIEVNSGIGKQVSYDVQYPTGLQPTFNGMFGDTPQQNELKDITNCRTLLDKLRDMIATVLGEIESITDQYVGHSFNLRGIRHGVEGIRDGLKGIGGGGLGGIPGDVGGIRTGVDNLTAYPMLVSGTESTPAVSPGPAGAVSVQRLVDNAMRQTLGRLPKYTDSKAFLAALNQSFEIKQFEGQTMVNWRVRSYVGQTELGGGVTGFQASLYARARDALSQSLPLLASLRPLLPDADVEEMAAARSIVESQFTSLVDELGVEGGPRSARVDEFFDTLLEDLVTGQDPNKPVKGMVGYLGEVFGLSADRVNTVDEERAFSDFLLLRDYITTLREAWNTFRDLQFGKDLGTQLVVLSKALQVVGESVDEVEAAMDSVFVGPAERTVIPFPLGDFVPDTMLVSELLTWIRSFATAEAPQLVQDGGRRGAGAIIGTAAKLSVLTDALIRALPHLPVAGLQHPRVRQPLTETRGYLDEVVKIARRVQKATTTPEP